MKKWIIAAVIGLGSLPVAAQQTADTYIGSTKEPITYTSKTGASVAPVGTVMMLHAQLHRQEQITGMNTLQERSVNESAAGFNTQLVLGYLLNIQHKISSKKPGEKIYWASLD